MRGFPVLRGAPAQGNLAEQLTWDLEKAGGWDRYWRRQKFAQIPEGFAVPVAKHYRSLYAASGEQRANLFLLELTERLAKLAITPSATDDDLIALAKRAADTCRVALQYTSNHYRAALRLAAICRRYEIAPPAGMVEFLAAQAAPSPGVASPSGGVLPLPAVGRLTDDAWWRRKIRVIHGRLLEAEAIGLDLVHCRAGRYVSDATFARHQQQCRRNKELLAAMVAINEEAEEIALEEIVAGSLANPKNRREELMVRIYGFDQLALALGHDAVLLTITCPSRMHAHLGKSGARNPKFDPSFNPKKAQEHLTTVWSHIRAKWGRQKIRPYGVRVTEAHHDGTPHWHVLLFIEPEHRQAMIETARQHALADSPDEPGAAEHRFEVKDIDRSKGSATGYIAKYIAKNVDGLGLAPSDDKPEPEQLARRTAAWASTWGIRQFQQVGGPPVSLWREFRRVPEIAANSSLLGQLADAANRGDWAQFVTLLGGPQAARKTLPVTLAKHSDSRPGHYGEPMGPRIVGICHETVMVPTRLHTWTIQRKAKPQNCTVPVIGEAQPSPSEPEAGSSQEGLPPWSSVNNCTAVGTGRTKNGT